MAELLAIGEPTVIVRGNSPSESLGPYTASHLVLVHNRSKYLGVEVTSASVNANQGVALAFAPIWRATGIELGWRMTMVRVGRMCSMIRGV
jgi:hypothetical protein